MAPSALGRRRGTTASSRRTKRSRLIAGVVVALLATSLLLGLLLGTHLLLSSSSSSSPDETGIVSNNASSGLLQALSLKEQHANVRGSISSGAVPKTVVKPEEGNVKPGAAMDDWDGQQQEEQDDQEDDQQDDGLVQDDDVEPNDLDDAAAAAANHESIQDDDNLVAVDQDSEDDVDSVPQRQEQQQHSHLRHKPQVMVDGKGQLPPDDSNANTSPYPYNLDTLVPPDHDFTSWTAPGGGRFDEYKTGHSPYSISKVELVKSDSLARSRKVHVRNAFAFAWSAYAQYAFGHDEVLPQSRSFGDNWGGMGTTLVDSLDTLWLMGLRDEFEKARQWVKEELHFDHVGSVSVFETTIRSLGGLLSAHDWSGDEVFLIKAQDLGDRLFKAFDTASGLPMGQVSLSSGSTRNIGWAGGNAISAEAGTLQLEFRYLAKTTHNDVYAKKSENVYTVLHKMDPPNGLYPYYIRNQQKTPTFANNKLTFGAMSDSLYEYMLKIWLQGGRTESLYREMYDKAIQGMHDELLQTSTPSGLTYIADKNGGVMDHKMDHLVCFMGGLLALGAYTDPLGLESDRAQRDLTTAKALTYTCYQMYARMKTGISAEYVQFFPGDDFRIGRGAPHYLLRPEAVESFFILNQLTGDPIYREWGWEVFCAIERYCKTDIAYGSLSSVEDVNGKPRNKMESFFLAETLKYLYLLQDPDTEVDVLNKHVFNTEAHPTRIFPAMDLEMTQ